MAFSLALDDLIITSFLANAETATLPMKVYSMIKKGVSPEINALTTIIFGVSMVAMLAYLIKELVNMITIRRKKSPFHLRFKQHFRPSCRYDRLHSQYGQLCEINKSYTHMQNIKYN